MKSRLPCICIGCQEEKKLEWIESYNLYMCQECKRYIKLHKTDKWHREHRAKLYARKYYWRKEGGRRWLMIYGLEEQECESKNWLKRCFHKMIQSVKSFSLKERER